MKILLALFLVTLKNIDARINIHVNGDLRAGSGGVQIEYSGTERRLINNHDLTAFHMTNDNNIKDAVKEFHGERPVYVYLKSPTPGANIDLYKTFNWNEVHRELTITSAKSKGVVREPVVVLTHDFNNVSNKTIKVNTGITHTLQNTVTTSWSKNCEQSYSYEVKCGLNFVYADFSSTSTFSTSVNWGKSEKKSESITIGTSTSLEMELKPGQAATAVLSATKGYLEIEIDYQSTLDGSLTAIYNSRYRGHYFWSLDVKSAMGRKGIQKAIAVTQTIKYGFYTNATLNVYDKHTGLLLL